MRSGSPSLVTPKSTYRFKEPVAGGRQEDGVDGFTINDFVIQSPFSDLGHLFLDSHEVLLDVLVLAAPPGEVKLLDELGDVDPRIIGEVVLDEFGQFFFVQLGRDRVNLVRRGDAAVEHELHVDHGQTVELVEVKEVEQDLVTSAYI